MPGNIAARQFELRASSCNKRKLTSAVRDALFSAAKWLRDSDAMLGFALHTFRTLQRMGISVVPNHYYWPIPDISSLNARHWRENSLPVGVDMRLDCQAEFLRETASHYLQECGFPEQEAGSRRYHYNNGFFETVDAEIAYAMVRSAKPLRVIEVGGGYSTRVLAEALERNSHETGHKAELITIDPFLERGASESYSNALVLRNSVQDVGLELFSSLDQGDIFFLDSSHVVAIGSDVVREYLDILPRLGRGVLIHVHDIFLPHDYPREFVYRNLCFWSEQYLLQAFLSFNPEYEILWGSSAMALHNRDLVDELLPRWGSSYSNMPQPKRRFVPTLDGQRVWPSSLWMRRR